MSLALSSLAIAVLAAVLYALFQKSAPTFSLLVSMAAALILLARVGSAAQSVLSGLVRLEQRSRRRCIRLSAAAVRASFC